MNTRHTQRRFLGFALALVSALAVAITTTGCSDPADWYPEGSAVVQSAHETAATDKQCIVTVAITNTGKSKIWRSTISVAVQTTLREYRATIASETNILPGGTIYASASIPYIDGTETLAPVGGAAPTGGAATGGSPARITGEFYE